MQSMQMIKLVLGANKTITLTFQERWLLLHIFYYNFLYIFISKESNKQDISIVIQWI